MPRSPLTPITAHALDTHRPIGLDVDGDVMSGGEGAQQAGERVGNATESAGRAGGPLAEAIGAHDGAGRVLVMVGICNARDGVRITAIAAKRKDSFRP